MNKDQTLTVFEKQPIRRLYDESKEMWYFSVIDVVAALTDSVNPRDYWFKMKIRVKSEDGFELSTVCRQFKMKASDGKMRETELIFTALAELSTRQIANPAHANGMTENAAVGTQGGAIARKARRELERKTGKSVVTGENFLPPEQFSKKLKKAHDEQ